MLCQKCNNVLVLYKGYYWCAHCGQMTKPKFIKKVVIK